MRRLLAAGALALAATGCGSAAHPTSKPSPTPRTAAAAAVQALWLGDSYTGGTGAGKPALGEACLTSDAMGWSCALDAEGGSGFIATGQANNPAYRALAGRLAATEAKYPHPGVVVVDAGRNDYRAPAHELESAASTYFDEIGKAWPAARFVVVAPYEPRAGATGYAVFRAWEQREAAERHWAFIDPLAEGWVAGVPTVSDHVHPTPAGHREIAAHLAADLRRLKV